MDNVAMMRKTLEEYELHKDYELAASVFSPDIVWHSAGSGRLAGEYRGLDALRASSAERGRIFEGWNVVGRLDGVTGNETLTAAVVHLVATRDDETQVWDDVLVYRWHAGSVVEAWDLGVLP